MEEEEQVFRFEDLLTKIDSYTSHELKEMDRQINQEKLKVTERRVKGVHGEMIGTILTSPSHLTGNEASWKYVREETVKLASHQALWDIPYDDSGNWLSFQTEEDVKVLNQAKERLIY
jgi:hypothetical protein